MNEIYHGNNINFKKVITKFVTGVDNYDNFIILDNINCLLLNCDYYKKKDSIYILNKLEDSLYNNFNNYKKYIIFLNIKDKIIQKYIKNNLLKLSNNNRLIIITNNINNIIGEIRNSFHTIYENENYIEYKYEPFKELVNETYFLYNRDLEPLNIEDVKKIKDISYNICKYDIPINRYINSLLDKFIDDPNVNNRLISRIIRLMADSQFNMTKSYRIIIHVENLLLSIYDEIITFYQ